MEAVHQCSAQGLQFTPAQHHSPEHQECCLEMALAGADVVQGGRPTCKMSSARNVKGSFRPKLLKELFVCFPPGSQISLATEFQVRLLRM